MNKIVSLWLLTFVSMAVCAESPFGNRDVYYKITNLSELHNDDTIVLVNETSNRVSAEFETYTFKKKNDKGVQVEYTAGRLKAAETEVIRVGDSIGCWGAYEIHVKNTSKGWQIYVTDWIYNPITTEDDKTETLIVASEKNKIMTKGEGNAYWDISFSNGNAVIKSKDSKAGVLQFNSNNKTFTTYTSSQQPIQIYRLAKQFMDEDDSNQPTSLVETTSNTPSHVAVSKVLYKGQIMLKHQGNLYSLTTNQILK